MRGGGGVTLRMLVPICAGDSVTSTWASRSAWIFSSAPPFPPEMMAPAWPIRRPGGAVNPAMNAATGFLFAPCRVSVPASYVSEGAAPCPYCLAPCPNSLAPCSIYIAPCSPARLGIFFFTYNFGFRVFRQLMNCTILAD